MMFQLQIILIIMTTYYINAFTVSSSADTLHCNPTFGLTRNCSTPRVSSLLLNSKEDTTNAVEKDKQQEQELTNQIPEMIEVSFIQACMQLAKGYVDVQKLFLAAIKAGYDLQIPLTELVKQVNDCPNNSANRNLTKEELDIRTTSMGLVYLTLNTIYAKLEEEKKTTMAVPSDICQKFEAVVQKQLEMQDNMIESTVTASTTTKDPIMTHYENRVISLTVTVVEEEKSCDGDGLQSTKTQPRPPIPGAY